MQKTIFHGGGASKAGWPDTTAGTITGGMNVGGEKEVFKATVAPNLVFRTLKQGTNITLTQNANDITLDCPAPGESNTASNLGAGSQVFKSKVGVDLQFRSIIGTGSITATQNANDITLNGTGEANTASNLGAGSQVFKSKVGVDLQFRSLVQGANITLTQNANDITIAASGSGSAFPEYHFFTDQVETPNNADWTVNAYATVGADSLNNALANRQFDDTTNEGIGFILDIPSTASNIVFSFRSRAQTAPGTAKQVLPKIYNRNIPDNAAVGAWTAGTDLTAIDIPITNAYFQYDTQTVALATLSLTAGRVTQFELVRNATSATDTLVGDWNLLELIISFT